VFAIAFDPRIPTSQRLQELRDWFALRTVNWP
jgi:hypothetical protein